MSGRTSHFIRVIRRSYLGASGRSRAASPSRSADRALARGSSPPCPSRTPGTPSTGRRGSGRRGRLCAERFSAGARRGSHLRDHHNGVVVLEDRTSVALAEPTPRRRPASTSRSPRGRATAHRTAATADHHDLRMKRRGHGPKVLTASLHVLGLGLIEALKRLDAAARSLVLITLLLRSCGRTSCRLVLTSRGCLAPRNALVVRSMTKQIRSSWSPN